MKYFVILAVALTLAGCNRLTPEHAPVQPEAKSLILAKKVAALLDEKPKEWKPGNFNTLYNKDRNIHIRGSGIGEPTGMSDLKDLLGDDMNQGPDGIIVEIDNIKMPGFVVDNKISKEEQVVYDALSRWVDATLTDQHQYSRDLQEKAMDRLLKEPM